jgi:hypothetical protein
MPDETGSSEVLADAAGSAPRTGPHRVLIAIYALFTLAAGARSGVQLAQNAAEAPLAYGLSAAAACTYAAGWYAIARAARGQTALASVLLWFELSGVLVVGTLSLLRPGWFPDATVWSEYGIGYGFVPAVLPICGLLWLRSQIRNRSEPEESDSQAAPAT